MKLSVYGLAAAFGLAASLVAVTAQAAPAADAKGLGGVYSSIRVNEDAGDVLGMEIDFRPAGPSPTVAVTICEGQCSETGTWPVKIDGRRIAFTVYEDLTDQNGRHSRRAEPFVGRFRSDGKLEVMMDGYPDTREVLHRVPRRGASGGH